VARPSRPRCLRYTDRRGDDYAAAITYFNVLPLVRLLMIASAIAGYVLSSPPGLREQLRTAITAAAPSELSATINLVIDQAIAQRSVVGAFGLLIALYSGIGWMSRLRAALSEQWAQRPNPPPLLRRLFSDLLALLGLGLALAGSFAITGLVSAFTGAVLICLGPDEHGYTQVLLHVLGVVLALTTNFLIFLWMIGQLPRKSVPLRSASRAALLGAIGFQVLTEAMSIYLRLLSGSPSGVVFGSMFGLLIFVYFVSRFAIFVTAWAATARGTEREPPAPIPAPAVIRLEVVAPSSVDRSLAAGLIGGAIVTALFGAAQWRVRRRTRCRRYGDRMTLVVNHLHLREPVEEETL
jgi:membrane protein